MSLIGKEIKKFKAQAYQNGEFKEITKEDLLGKWNVLFSILPILLLYVQQN